MAHRITQPLAYHALVEAPDGRLYINPIPIAAAPSAGEGGRPAKVAGGSLANVSKPVHGA
ncbi:hypothetical protein [Sphingobium sp. AntQ-1]|uniref:hypothetical protein n=1 Tax=Sphingobium sp. AntQ-1 TaxID=2930091 RepID=UPI003FA7EB49